MKSGPSGGILGNMRLRLSAILVGVTLAIPAGATAATSVQQAQTRFDELLRQSMGGKRPELRAREADGVYVPQKGATVLRAGNGKRYLQSAGAGPCVLVLLYDASAKTGALAHIDATTDTPASVRAMVQALGAKSPSAVEARLIGGLSGISEDVFLDAIPVLDEMGVRIREVAIKSENKQRSFTKTVDGKPVKYLSFGDAIVMDVETGSVYDMVGMPPDGEAPDLEGRDGRPVDITVIR